ncbi:STAS domain-containing protein [Nocardia sp. MW-W600-9]
MSVLTGRRRASRLRWYPGPPRGGLVQRLRRRARPGCWVLFAGNELDAAHQPHLRALLERSIRDRARVMVLDLRETEFLSIRVAGSLSAAKAEAWGHGVELRLLAGGPGVERALELVGVRPLFRYYTSLDEASKSPG